MIGALIEGAATATAIAGGLVIVSSIVRRREWRDDIPLTLDFWTAASLLSLFGEVTWLRLASTAAIIGAQNLMTVGRGIGAGETR